MFHTSHFLKSHDLPSVIRNVSTLDFSDSFLSHLKPRPHLHKNKWSSRSCFGKPNMRQAILKKSSSCIDIFKEGHSTSVDHFAAEIKCSGSKVVVSSSAVHFGKCATTLECSQTFCKHNNYCNSCHYYAITVMLQPKKEALL